MNVRSPPFLHSTHGAEDVAECGNFGGANTEIHLMGVTGVFLRLHSYALRSNARNKAERLHYASQKKNLKCPSM